MPAGERELSAGRGDDAGAADEEDAHWDRSF